MGALRTLGALLSFLSLLAGRTRDRDRDRRSHHDTWLAVDQRQRLRAQLSRRNRAVLQLPGTDAFLRQLGHCVGAAAQCQNKRQR